MRTIRIGLIGLGGMAQTHIGWMKEEGRFSIVAISDVKPEIVEQVGLQLGIASDKRYTDFKQLVADSEVEAVVAVTPNNVHAEILQACLHAQKPFLAEKPFTRTFEEAVPLLKLYEQHPVPAMFGFSYRYTPAFRYARELLREGKIGTVRSFSIQYLQGWGAASHDVPYVWRFNKEITGTGTLGDLGSHMIDLARFLFGEFEELTAQMHTIIPERRDPATDRMVKVEVDDFASFLATMSSGARGVFQTTRNAIGSDNQHEVSIFGDSGTIHASTVHPDQLVWIHEEVPGQHTRSTLEVPSSCRVSQYSDFVALLDGSPRDGLPGFMDAYRNQEILEAIIQSSAAKHAVRV